ncbi:hypothetical protein EX30DRAFT_350221 [Ascodesmis nigricans]|uniref:BZIP domain-containing protein n=1 Tax=Ascodesmis nigricans TaxID=341454 RepID=A0A4S2MQT9_9PEZI|nr:hypothetical protein EX30DRAFT_350221 [Ascodesmis nigricans]
MSSVCGADLDVDTAIASPAASVGSPTTYPTLAPSIAPAAPSPEACGSPVIVTQKEWVIPPRPKPGRKPATDTPPTKRKAQNRAAQRAFRERRAARVNELEDKLKQVAEETAATTANYVAQITALTKTNSELALANTALQKQIAELQEKMKLLESTGGNEGNGEPGQAIQQMASPAPSSDHDDLAMPISIPTPQTSSGAPSGCCRSGGSSNGGGGGGCACLAAAASSSTSSTISKRSTSPSISDSSKRRRYDYLETDFTTAFSSSRRSTVSIHSRKPRISRPPPDPCGFCSEGTPCVCAEVANAMDMASSDNESIHDFSNPHNDDDEEASFTIPNTTSPITSPMRSHRALSPLSSSLQLAPLLTDLDDFSAQQVLPNITPNNNTTTNNSSSSSGCSPGNCAQCRADPMSTLFCQSVVSNKVLDIETPPPSISTLLSLGRPSSSASNSRGQQQQQLPSRTYIPCSAAYQTLSRHRGFDEAAADLGSLVRPLVVERGEGGCPRVEVSSVRDVLKMLDRRFGRGTEG